MTANPHTVLCVLLGAVTAAAATGVAVRRANAIAPAPPVASVSQLMRGVITPASDAIFMAAAFEVTAAGAIERGPETAAQWRSVERSAALLGEAAELLLVEGRDVSHSRLVALDRQRWSAYALALRESATWARDAARARSTSRLLATGGDISFACERCHLDFRFPASRGTTSPSID